MKRALLVLFGILVTGGCPRPDIAPKPAPPAFDWKSALTPAKYVDALSPEQNEDYLSLTNELLCPCGGAETLADCVVEMRCPVSLRAAGLAARVIKLGASREQAAELVQTAYGKSPISFALAASPKHGPASATVEVVEFADFECSHCARLAPVLEETLAARPEARLYFKYFPIAQIHPNAQYAAEAAALAQQQGKFWALHKLLFASSQELTPGGIVALGEQAGLSRTELEQALTQSKFRDQVLFDLSEGTRAGVDGTPSLYIDGRPFVERLTREDIERAILEADATRRASCVQEGCR